MTEQAEKPTGLALMREEFQDHQISKLPKPTKQQTEAVKQDYKNGKRCTICGTWHHPDVVHLDYVGHAAITNRLLDVDPNWTWEPLAVSADGLPQLDKHFGLWIKLTVCGVTRLGYGDAPNKSGGDAMKETIGDAIRNASMRFGAALELWHKGDQLKDEDENAGDDQQQGEQQQTGNQPPKQPETYSEEMFKANFPTWKQLIEGGRKTSAQIIAMVESKAPLAADQKKKINAVKKLPATTGAPV